MKTNIGRFFSIILAAAHSLFSGIQFFLQKKAFFIIHKTLFKPRLLRIKKRRIFARFYFFYKNKTVTT